MGIGRPSPHGEAPPAARSLERTVLYGYGRIHGQEHGKDCGETAGIGSPGRHPAIRNVIRIRINNFNNLFTMDSFYPKIIPAR